MNFGGHTICRRFGAEEDDGAHTMHGTLAGRLSSSSASILTAPKAHIRPCCAALRFLTQAGRDRLILDFAGGGADTLDSAAVVKSAMRFVIGINDGGAPNVLAGVCTDGVIARYAVPDAGNLDVSLFASLDAPHQ